LQLVRSNLMLIVVTCCVRALSAIEQWNSANAR